MSQNEGYEKLKKRLKMYISKYPLPKQSENLDNFKKLNELKLNQQSKEYIRLRDKLIISNGGFGMKYAVIYCKKVNDHKAIEDIFQQAQIGIIEAVDRFDTEKKVNFTTFAFYYVIKNIIDYIRKNKIVTAPSDIARHIKHVIEVDDKLFTNSNGLIYDSNDIKEILLKEKGIELSTMVINDILKLIELNSSSEGDTMVSGGVEELIDDHSHIEINLILKSILLNDLKTLDNETLTFIKARFGIENDRPLNIEEIKLLYNLNDKEIEEIKEKTKIILNK